MFAELSSSLSNLPSEDRTRLAQLLTKRNDYMKEVGRLNELRIQALTNPSPQADQAVSDFSSTVVAPLRDSMAEDTVKLLNSAVKIDGLKSLMPMIVMGALQSVNLPLLFTTCGVEPDMIDKVVAEVSTYIKSGM